MAVVFTADGVELREASGESFSTIARAGRLTVKQQGSGLALDVDGNAVAWVPSASGGPFKRVDTRSFMIATTDIMSFYYVTLPKGLPEATYEHLAAIFTAAKEGKPLPEAPAAAVAAAVAAAGEPAPSAPPAPAGTEAAVAPAAAAGQAPGLPQALGDFMGALARKAAHDTQMLGQMIQQKAAHDMNAMNEGKQKPPAPADA